MIFNGFNGERAGVEPALCGVVRRLVGIAVLFTAVNTVLYAQVAVPKYRGPEEAPTPQMPELPRPQPSTPGAVVVEFPIARVNDRIIDNSDYLRAEQQLTEEAQQTGMSDAELADRRKNLLRDLVDQQLLISRGKELGIVPDTDVIRQLDEIRKKYHFDSMEALEKAVRESGTSFEDFKAKIANSIISQEVVREEVARKLTLTQKEEQAYYDAHKEDFAQPEQVRLSEILVPTPDDATDAQVAQAQAKATDIEAKLKAGAKFEDMVKQYSGGPNADSGGDLGVFKRGQLGSALLENPTFALEAGQWTSPIRTRQGFIILEVTEHQKAGIPPLKAVEDQVQQAIYEKAMQPALRTYLTGLREKAFIDIAQGYTDTGASSKQTKPVFASASEPVVKKKVQRKARLERQRAAAQAAEAQAKLTAAKAGASGKKKKIHREKIRFGQMPQNSLPETPEETVTSGEGPGAPSSGQAAAEDANRAAAAEDQGSDIAANDQLPGSDEPDHKKTRFSSRQAEMSRVHAQEKLEKAKAKIQMAPPPMTPDETVADKTRNAALGLNGDTSKKKKKKKDKNAPKERIQQAAPAPPAPKPEATPIPPRSVRQNGEPEVAPAPANLPPPVLPPSTQAAPSDTAPSSTPQ